MNAAQAAFVAASVVCLVCVGVLLFIIHLAGAIDNERPQE